MLDQKHFSAEQIDFLDKFFKENPWADNAQIESIVKATGLAEPVIKVKRNEQQYPFIPLSPSGLYRSTSC